MAAFCLSRSTAAEGDTGVETAGGGSSAGVPGDPFQNQARNTFTTLEDGQPGEPDQPQLTTAVAWAHGDGGGTGLLQFQMAFTPGLSPFMRNANFKATLPVAIAGGTVDAKEVVLSWSERWLRDVSDKVSSGTKVTVVPGAFSDEGKVQLALTFFGAKDLGPGVAYLNVLVGLTGKKNDGRGFYGGIVAYSVPLSSRSNLVVNFLHTDHSDEDPANQLEFCAEYNLSDRAVLGAGLWRTFGPRRDVPDTVFGLQGTVSF